MACSSSSSGIDGGVKFKMVECITYDKLYAEISKLKEEYRFINSNPIAINYDELLSGFKARAMKVFQGNHHPNLLLGFNTLLHKEHQITLPLQHFQTNGKKTKKGKKMKVEEYNSELSWDVLDIICKTLDFDDLFQFAGVCKSWRAFHKIYWITFLASQKPLLLQYSSFYGSRLFSFISIPEQKVYCLKMMKHSIKYSYLVCCGGYFIMERYTDNSLLLINPFTRIKKVIDTHAFEDRYHDAHILLAFGKCSEEFVLVLLYKYSMSLHVYQSRNSAWVTYSTKEIQGNVVDFVVFQNIIYVVTNKGNIGVLSLNSANIKFLKLKGTCIFTSTSSCKLVNCDEQLLVVDCTRRIIKAVYKIDFSTMSYVKLDTLGDIALFYSLDKHCYGLSNPNKWGYDSNSVYVVTHSYVGYSVYSGDEKLEKYLPLPTSHGTGTFMYDWCCVYSGDEDKLIEYIWFPSPPAELGHFSYYWCFRHLRYEVDYSLVE